MQKRRAIKSRIGKKIKPAVSSSAAVNATQVISSLFGLFDDLGVVVSHPISRSKNVGRNTPTANTLYPHASEIGEMLTYWHQHPEYLDEGGNPARIKLRGRRASFRRLAQLKAPNMDVLYLLSELQRLGAVSIDESNLITVNMRSFPVYEDKRLAAQHTLNVLEGFIRTLRHNLDSSPSNSDQLFHRIAWNDGFDCRALPALKVRVKRHGQSFLESFDDWLMQKTVAKKRISTSRSKRAKVSIGVYLSVESN